MTSLWLASYMALWALNVGTCLVLVGLLRQIGLLQRDLGQVPMEPAVPALENDGPAIGSRIPDLGLETVNGFGSVALKSLPNRCSTLLMFMSPLCEPCQHTATVLNGLVEEDAQAVQPIVIMRADEHACQAFLRVYPLHVPTVSDRDRAITMGLDIHRAPFGLLYNEHGTLIRKGVVEMHEDLLALRGDTTASVVLHPRVFPQPQAPVGA